MGISVQEIAARLIAPTLTPAVRQFLDGLAEIIARDILKHQAGQAGAQEEPDRAPQETTPPC